MTAERPDSQTTGLLGPVALSVGLVLVFASPLVRGGNRHAALIVLEFLALAMLAAIVLRVALQGVAMAPLTSNRLLMVLLASPVLVALAQLVPLPAALWDRLPGHAPYADALREAAVTARDWRPASISPAATAGSLLAALPIVAVLLAGYLASIPQLRVLVGAVVAMALGQVLLGLMQVAGGEHSPLFFGMLSFGPPIGTFANRNSYAIYLAMALVALIWLAYESHRDGRIEKGVGTFGTRHRTALWAGAGLMLVVGIMLSRSRGAALFGLPMAAFALAAAALRIRGWSRGWRFALPLAVLLVVSATVLIGLDAATSRFTSSQLSSSAEFRALLARTSVEGAMAFWPIGSGWGTYALAYPRFQPVNLPGFANQAHMDYIQFLFEGGVLALVFGTVFGWLTGRRAFQLARRAWRDRTLDRDAMAAAIGGMGLMALLLHSLVDFNMRIPANAMLGALLAGMFLRPLPGRHPAP